MKLLKIKNNRAFVILLAVVISSIILAIALSIANIALKEEAFSTSALNSNNAFIAADVGVECALANDRTSSGRSAFISNGEIWCFNRGVHIFSPANTPPEGTSPFKFIIQGNTFGFGLGTSINGCAIITVTKTSQADPSDPTKTDIKTTIVSDGYNVGDSNCLSTDPNRVNRELQVTYTL